MEFCTGNGIKYTAKNGAEYPGIKLREIAELMANPDDVPKDQARWIIPSTYRAADAREHDAQRVKGLFSAIVIDLDSGNHSQDEIQAAINTAIGNVAILAYATKSAEPDDKRWRIIIPRKAPLAWDDHIIQMRALLALLERQGIKGDPCATRAGQVAYLPNRGAYYEYLAHRAEMLGQNSAIAEMERQISLDDARKEENAKRAKAEREKLRASRPMQDGENPTEWFNANHSVTDMLERYGYQRLGQDYRSPQSTTGSFAVRAFGDAWVSHSGTDFTSGIGVQAVDKKGDGQGYCWGDAFDLYVFYEHGNDKAKAWRELRKEMPAQKSAPLKQIEPGKTGPKTELDAAGGIQLTRTNAAPEAEPALPLQSSADFCAARTPADYLIDGVIRDGWLYTLTGPTGHGKSAVAMAISFAIAVGGFLGSREIKQGHVLFLAGENADDIRERWIAMCEFNNVNPQDVPVTFLPGVWDLRRSMSILQAHFKDNPIRLVVVDTLAAFFDGENENDNTQQQEFATQVLRPLTELPGRPTVLVPAHPTKGAGKDNLTPKGGSSLLNAIDGNITAWNRDGTVDVHWQGKFRGAPWSPMYFELKDHKSDQLVDSRGRHMPTVVSRAMVDAEIGTAQQKAINVENQVLQMLSDGISIRDIGDAVIKDGKPVGRNAVSRMVKSLVEQKWLTKSGRKLVLTKQGEAALAQANDFDDF